MGITVGIDFGRANSAVARINPETSEPEIISNSMGQLLTPSAICFFHDGSVRCGEAAEREYEEGSQSCVGAFKHEMGTDKILVDFKGKGYTARELAAIFLKYLEDDMMLGGSFAEAIIAVPAYFDAARRVDIYLAAREAGIRVRRFINEPAAAALYYCFTYSPERRTRILVYDLGGSFDVSVLEIDPADTARGITFLACGGDHTLGGRDWNLCLQELLLKKCVEEYGVCEYEICEEDIREFRMEAEYVKQRLSRREKANVVIHLEDGNIFLKVTRDEFDAVTRHLLDRTMSLVDHVLDTADCSDNDLDAVLVIGGCTVMPQVREMLNARFGDKVRFGDPFTAVAKGAALASTYCDF